jgi:hypothetical protein
MAEFVASNNGAPWAKGEGANRERSVTFEIHGPEELFLIQTGIPVRASIDHHSSEPVSDEREDGDEKENGIDRQ